MAKQSLSLEALKSALSAGFESIADLQEFASLPAGMFKLEIIKCELKDFGKPGEPDAGIAISLEVKDCLELLNLPEGTTEEEKEQLMQETTGSLLYRRYSGDTGLSRYKKEFGSVAEELNTTAIDFIDKAEGIVIHAHVSARVDASKVKADGTPMIWNAIEVANLA